jgi:UDP-N-acetylglucosamine 2-epimerase (non-hydrolysing)
VGKTMIALEKVFIEQKPDWVVVVGDVNATLAGSVSAKKLHIRVAHIEAGLRSRDEKMPEEINRLVTDRLSDLLLTPDKMASQNLRDEGVPDNKISFVGNIMIDTLERNRQQAEKLKIEDIVKNNSLVEINSRKFDAFALLTMHRPSNVDKKEILEPIIDFLLNEVSEDQDLFWPIHPRTKAKLQEFGLWEKVRDCKNLFLLSPLGYHEMLKLNMSAKIVLTDSGGLQEECTVLGTPCLTLRWNTERPITLREYGGASVLVGNDINIIKKEYRSINLERKPDRPELWDGETAYRIVKSIISHT